MEKILQQILEGQTKLVENVDKIAIRLDQLEDGQDKISIRLDQLEDGQSKIAVRLDQLEDGQDKIIQRLGIVDTRLENIECKIAENTRFINALSQDVALTATKKDITNLDNKFDVLNNRLFQQEAKILSLVK